MIVKKSSVEAAQAGLAQREECAQGQSRGEERALPPQKTPRPVHVFTFAGVRFAYFVSTGDVVQLGEAAFAALGELEAGQTTAAVLESVASRFSSAEVDAVRADLALLEGNGYLRPEITLTDPQRLGDIESLLAHQPRNLMFLVTEACNLACTYCYELNQGVHAKARMLKQVDAQKTIDAYLEDTRRTAVDVTFFGGEPLLNFPVVRDTVAYAKQKAKELGKTIGFTMTTNLTLLTEEYAEFLASERFHVMVSLDGDRESNDRYRKTVSGAGTYDQVVANLQLLSAKMKSHGVRLPKIRATLTEHSPDPMEVEEHLRSLGTPLVEVGDTHGTIANGRQSFDVSPDKAAHSRGKLQQHVADALAGLERDPTRMPELAPSIVKGLRSIHDEVTRSEVHETTRPSLCGVCRNMKAVTPTGDLYPCHRYVGMDEFKFGNVHEGGMDPRKVRDYYDRIYGAFEEKCAPCWARHLCGGQCPWYLSRPDGSVGVPDDETCDMIREGFEAQMGLYAVLLGRFPEAFEKLLGEKPESLTGGADGTEGCGC